MRHRRINRPKGDDCLWFLKEQSEGNAGRKTIDEWMGRIETLAEMKRERAASPTASLG
jgi:hypothetical protein